MNKPPWGEEAVEAGARVVDRGVELEEAVEGHRACGSVARSQSLQRVIPLLG